MHFSHPLKAGPSRISWSGQFCPPVPCLLPGSFRLSIARYRRGQNRDIALQFPLSVFSFHHPAPSATCFTVLFWALVTFVTCWFDNRLWGQSIVPLEAVQVVAELMNTSEETLRHCVMEDTGLDTANVKCWRLWRLWNTNTKPKT